MGTIWEQIETFSIKKEGFKNFETLLYQMVAGVHIERVWKIKNQVIRTSSADVISILSKKKIFSRNFMEKTMGLTTGQAYWYIKRLLKTGMIRKLKATEYVGNKGKQQALYKYVSK